MRLPLPALLLLGACATTPAGAPQPADGLTAARRAELKFLVTQDCGSCHGLTLKGGLGRPLRAERMASFTEDALTIVILEGVPGTAMPPWRPLLTPDEARFIARGLREGRFEP